MTPRTELSKKCPPDFVAVILAASSGARLFPLTTTTSDVDDGGVGASFDDDDGDSDHVPPPEPNRRVSNDEEEDAGGGGGGGGGLPKHLLPVGGTPVLTRLVRTVRRCGGGRFRHCVVAVAHGDRVTVRELRLHYRGIIDATTATTTTVAAAVVRLVSDDGSFVVTVVTLPPDCAGSADALRHLLSVDVVDDDNDDLAIIPRGSGVVVMPGDLVLEGGGLLGLLTDAHRGSGPGSGSGGGFGGALGGAGRGGHQRAVMASSCTVLLSDVGEEDEAGVPLKESAKHKKGGLARDEEDMEYIGLSSVSQRVAELQRIVLKRSKIDVEEDAEMAGDTPKLSFPKSRLVGGVGVGRRNDGGIVRVRTDLSDLHVYVLSPWVLRLIQSRTKLTSLQGEILPLLITRQFKGVRAAFGEGDSGSRKRGESFSLRQGSSSMQIQGGQDQTTPREEEVPNEVLTSLWEDAAKPWPWSSTPPPRGGDVGGLDGGNSDEVNTPRVVDSPAYETRSSSSSSSSGGGVVAGVGHHHHRRPSPPPEMPFVVTCTVLPRGSRLAVRACTVPSYLYACREMVSHAIRFPPPEELIVRDANGGPFTPSSDVGAAAGRARGAVSVLSSALASSFDGLEGRILHKFNSVVLPDCDVGDKVTIKSSTVGRRCTLGNRCRLNNVVLMDGAVIGENCVLQNSVVGPGGTVGENCSLNDVQVGPGADVASGTKLKGESVTRDMVMLDAPGGGTGFS